MPTDTTSAGPPSGRWPNSTSTIRTLETRSAALCLTDPNPFVRPEAVQTLAWRRVRHLRNLGSRGPLGGLNDGQADAERAFVGEEPKEEPQVDASRRELLDGSFRSHQGLAERKVASGLRSGFAAG